MENVGILVDRKVFQMMKNNYPGNGKLDLYNLTARQEGMTPVYLNLAHINLRNKRAVGYRYSGGQYLPVHITLPQVIYNRALPMTGQATGRLNRLNRLCLVFNGRSRYTKYEIHRLLNRRFKASLPVTTPYSIRSLASMMKRHEQLYVKPQSSSLGNGIIKLTRMMRGRWHVRKPRGSQVVTSREAVRIVHQLAGREPYLIQKGITLAQYRGRPYDIRVAVQRNETGAWQVSGMMGRVARRGSHVTNVSRGGTVKAVHSLLQHSFKHPESVSRSVRSLSLNISRYLSTRLRNLADVGLDIGVDAKGKPYFIEANFRYQRNGFKKAGMRRTHRLVHQTPIRYARYLLRRR